MDEFENSGLSPYEEVFGKHEYSHERNETKETVSPPINKSFITIVALENMNMPELKVKNWRVLDNTSYPTLDEAMYQMRRYIEERAELSPFCDCPEDELFLQVNEMNATVADNIGNSLHLVIFDSRQ